jgi:cytochrome bd-type quinol oxidase subunit 2
MSEIDWSVELRKIEREFDGLPRELSPAEQRERREAEERARQSAQHAAAAFGAWVRLLLVVILAGAINFWPYAHACGPGLVAYMGAELVILAGGAWVAVRAWQRRTGAAHTVAFAMALWGCALLAAEVLPRIGYAKVDPLAPPSWSCGS